MIYDKLENLNTYTALHPNLAIASQFLTGVAEEPTLISGKNPILENQVFLMKQMNELTSKASSAFEYHQCYADLHIVTEGAERISYGSGRINSIKEFDETNDFGLVSCSEQVSFDLKPGYFLLFFPNEAHQPGKISVGGNLVKKQVVKILI
ncbi:YhcH/YjgK/YiaL family protein [Enterococcus dongliensis]|uniref:YhcH/YjgK/YiaL family protein n=1 Tax=Enterococcus dongliensis TaxID=2559925 RepID=UPI002891C183|nr:YhcH/YjgK/YiaL family protein [Enterococcus dongliensis]MDT2703923.1 YhcH/YjgK/YiaL family protein [Enterococcus dongliensis]